ncbi:class I SAM-dependent methyltransferase [Heliobacterium chlorum]|uniref:Class I SAM-dependent methyltransferase n=1 Tax=Heliobacterium chlorum TaxID=2698 RepID=A0ABR7T0J2_HELCL|nr:class I SAM-dependent methyltransferase [Heliobacterium chlorum]MBC9783810.1 class I SAM-dependent methyltransferase [Heliobacterium chlorum]
MVIVTTALEASSELIERAKAIAAHLEAPFAPREQKSLDTLRREYDRDQFLIVKKNRIVLRMGNEEFFFHPNMAVHRVRALKRGQAVPLVEALDIRSGDCILDCTIGLGADAIVAAYAAGTTGKVTGIEHSSLIALIVREGLRSTKEKLEPDVIEAMGRIEVVQGDHRHMLREFPDNSFDSVYFDPMFRNPQKNSDGIAGIRSLADLKPLEPTVIKEACRVARRRVVMKERSNSDEWYRLQPDQVLAGKYASVGYGIWYVGGKDRG